MKLTINAAILDAIDLVMFFVEQQKEVANKVKTLEYCLEDTDAKTVRDILCNNDVANCHFSENSLYVSVPLTQEEISKEIEDLQDGAEYWIGRLIKWSDNSEEYKEQISRYLQAHYSKYAVVISMLANRTI
jgi:hypothetical protein